MDFNFFTLVFLVLLTVTVAIRMWLAARHARHVSAHRHRVPSGFADAISLEAHQKAADYSIAKTRFARANLIVETVLLLAFTLGGGLKLLDQFWRGQIENELFFGVALIASVIVISAIVELPLSLYRTFRIEARFGFNRMTLKLFFIDLAKQAALGAVIGLPLILGVLWLMERMGEYWWLYAWAGWAAFTVLMLALYPTLIAPLFNKFNPLTDAQLKDRIEQLLAKCGFKSNGLFVMDGSKRSSHGNAYFTGFGRAKRIVFFDTLVNRLEPAEVEAVLAHELGHFKMRHVVRRMVLTFAMSLAFFWLLSVAIDAEWFYEGLNAGTPSNAMALILFVLLGPLVAFPLQPLFAMYSRKHEFEADAYAAAYANAKELINALVKLYKDNASTLTPDPLHSAVYDSHPPAAVRIAKLQGSL
jgi:STE24 endopeptidase